MLSAPFARRKVCLLIQHLLLGVSASYRSSFPNEATNFSFKEPYMLQGEKFGTYFNFFFFNFKHKVQFNLSSMGSNYKSSDISWKTSRRTAIHP